MSSKKQKMQDEEALFLFRECFTRFYKIVEDFSSSTSPLDSKMYYHYDTLLDILNKLLYDNDLYKKVGGLPNLPEMVEQSDFLDFDNNKEYFEGLKPYRQRIEIEYQLINAPRFDIKDNGYLAKIDKFLKEKKAVDKSVVKMAIDRLDDEGESDIFKKDEKINEFPYKLPRGTKWEQIYFKFIDDENVLINVGRFKHKTNYKEMGFIGKGKDKPSEQWVFLRALSIVNGEIVNKDVERVNLKYKKQKELLSKNLEGYFRTIGTDPFYPYEPCPPYKTDYSYKIRMTLIPATEG